MFSEQELHLIRTMTPAAKLRAAHLLIEAERSITEAAIRKEHPEWTDEEVRKALREAILYARD